MSNYDSITGGSHNWNKADEYKVGNMYDTIIKKLNVVRLKDCNIYLPAGAHGSYAEKEYYICVEVPDDMLMPERPDQTTDDTAIGAMLLSNNLSEIPPLDETLVAQHKPDTPFFVQDLVKMPVIKHDKDGKPYQKEIWCWIIIATVECCYKNQDLLSKTQIVYPITPKSYRVPNSGFTVALADGSYIESWKYTQITSEGDVTYTFKGSPFGYANIKIQKSQIVSVTPAQD